MLWVIVALAVVCGVCMIVGFVLMVKHGGRSTRRSGPEVGAELMGAMADDDEDAGLTVPVYEASFFKGKATSVKVEGSVGFDEIKAALAERRWRDAVPGLMAMLGMFGLLLFGSLILVITLTDKWIGVLFLATSIYGIVRASIGFLRA